MPARKTAALVCRNGNLWEEHERQFAAWSPRRSSVIGCLRFSEGPLHHRWMTTDAVSTVGKGLLLAQGRTADVYAWDEDRILKLFHASYPRHWIEREIENGRAVAAMGLPVPQPVDVMLCDGRTGILYERVNGDSMLQIGKARPWLLSRMARTLAELHTRIHAQDATGFGGLSESLRETIEQVDDLPPRLRAGVLKLLDRLPDGKRLCHFDFHPDQVLMTSSGPVIIDWMTACRGNPLADVARTCLLLTVGHVPYGGRVLRALLNLSRKRLRRGYIARYLELNPDTTYQDISTWMVPVAAGRLREGIDGEKAWLLQFIEEHLPAS